MQRRADQPFVGAGPTVVGHRGAPWEARENTPAAFAAAAAGGATWVELDARMDAEGRVIVHHDPVLADGRPLIALGAREVEAQGISTLEQVLRHLPPGLGMDLEIKNLPGEPDHDEDMAVVSACAEVLRRLAQDRPVVVSSFNPMVLMAAADVGVEVPLALLTSHVRMDAALDAAVDLGCAALFPHHLTEGLDATSTAAAHEAGLQVMAWTVDDHGAARALVAAGVDALCTNDPAGLVAALSLRR